MKIQTVLSAIVLACGVVGCKLDLGTYYTEPAAAVDIKVATDGTPTDTNGYVVRVKRAMRDDVEPQIRRVLATDSVRVTWSDIGVNGESLEITLTDVGEPCTVSGDSMQTTSAFKGRTVPAVVEFRVVCP